MTTETKLHYRRLETLEEYRACVDLQRDTWGHDFVDTVPLSILKVSQRIGGVAAGAFDAEDALVGFVFGMTGVEKGRLVHWSDMLAVRPKMQGSGVGYDLKCLQRDLLIPLGVETMYWTFDPLEAKNAYFNLNKLGGTISEYVEDMYGETSSVLHEGLGTDRMVVEWDMASELVGQRLTAGTVEIPESYYGAHIVNRASHTLEGELCVVDTVPNEPYLRVETPETIQEEKRLGKGRGARWRTSTRSAFVRCFEEGYRVVALHRDDSRRCFYCLERD